MRIVTVLFSLGIVMLSGCSDEQSPEVADSQNAMPMQAPDWDQPAPPTESLPAPTNEQPPAASDALALTQVWQGDLDAMVERRVIRVLTVYGPGRFYLNNGPKGTVAEYANRLASVLNQAFDRGHLKVNVIVIPVARNQLIPALIEGRGDIVMAGITVTGERSATIDFTQPMSKPLNEILVTGPAAPPVAQLEDLAGKTIYVRESSSYATSVDALNQRLTEAGKPAIVIEYLSELLEDEDLIEMVNAGLLPWIIVDDYKPQMWKDVFSNIDIRDDLMFRQGGYLAWAIRKDSPKIKNFLNDFLDDNREGTLFGNILKNRYVRDFDWASNALAEAELGRYQQLEAYFRRHGTEYGIDPALLAAQGFQESRLDQSVRSHAGAIGVMQLLPSTARDKNVAIANIDQVEPNIEAGAKYMAFLRNRYFSDPAYDELNSALLALAAYNAGPAKVRRMQKLAQERGYDPSVWFDNVEVIAAEVIGRETVQYVSNIFKYYLTYEMINRQSTLREAAKAGIEA